MVLLGKRRGPSNIYFCSGVLLNKNYVVTAAHCVLEPDPFFARFGEHDYKIPSSTAPEDIDVQDVIFHPKYKVNRGYYDMALLKLKKPVGIRAQNPDLTLDFLHYSSMEQQSLGIYPILKLFKFHPGIVRQWNKSGRPSRVLREVVLEIFEPKVCEVSYSKLPDFVADYPEGMNKTTIVCAGDKSGGKDTCQGDSGGPMVEEGRNGHLQFSWNRIEGIRLWTQRLPRNLHSS
ncbi:Serine protease Hayan [Armadillidium nasatum]|uniref:Serine protease Hayan n=1 Tax=Armadillidium nasatum TaxID=96803 RepID=A0A5N5SPN0_9CRUS|nr:Serine protease Hayan [Armadillidium nasatum]